MEFCEPIYIYHSLFPQFLSALVHFPYIPFFYLLKTQNKSKKKNSNFLNINSTCYDDRTFINQSI